MMLLKRYIKGFRLIFYFKSRQSLRKASTHSLLLLSATLLIALLPGCSSLSDTEKSDENLDANIDVVSKDIVEMVDVAASDEQSVESKTAILLDVALFESKKNLYLEQAEQRLANVPVQILTQYKQALALMKKQQWQAAEQLFDEILVSQPQLSGPYVNKALIAIEKKELNKANEALNKALAVNSNNPYAHQLKGQVARFLGNFEQAEKSYLVALTIWPDYSEAQINLAILLELYRGRLLDARTYYMAYLKLKPDDVQVQRWLAGVEIKIKRAGLSLPDKTENKLHDNVQDNLSLKSSVNASGAG